MVCLVCGQGSDVGRLCRECLQQVPVGDGLIPEHIESVVPSMDADAWLVDGFGVAHGVAPKSMMGRSKEGPHIRVLVSSVSREHAELKESDGVWQVRDLGSHNGTFVNGTRVDKKAVLPARAVLKLGDVTMWFLLELADDPPPPETIKTMTKMEGMVRFSFCPTPERELLIVGTADVTKGGTLMSRTKGAEEWRQDELPKLEFHLLRTLCACAVAEATSPVAARGCVPTKELARLLPFQTRFANEENVRQVVRRVRGQLAEVGAPGTLDVVPGRGYYITCPVTLGAR